MPAKASPKQDSKKSKTDASSKKRIPLVKVRGTDAPQRQIKMPTYRSFRLSKRIKLPAEPLPSVFKISREALGVLRRNWKLFGGIVAVYLLLTVLLVKGLNLGSDLGATKSALSSDTGSGQVATGVSLFGSLLGTSGSSGDVASLYQAILLVVISLVVIWALRQTYAEKKVGVKESFYHGTYPLVQFVLVLLVIVVQLLPLVIAGYVFNITIFGGIAATAIEQVLWILLSFLLIVWSIYMLTSSLFALYIVTLPDVTPMQALRSAGDLVRHRRWTVMRKVLFLPIGLYIAGIIIMLPIVLVLTVVAEYFFLVLTMAALAVTHAYMYALYRKML